MVLCPRRNKLSKKYTHDKVEIMVALFFEAWKSVDKLWCLWTNYSFTLQFYWTKVNPRNPLISLIIFTKVRQFCKPSFFKNYGRDTLYEFPQVGIIVTYIAPAMYLDTVSYVCLVIFPFHHLTITSQDLYQEV